MNKKLFFISLILFIIFIFANACYATSDVIMDLNNLSTGDNAITFDNNISVNTVTPPQDNTIYSPSQTDNTQSDYVEEAPITTTTTEYEDSGELSITNMINIILIVVGIVLILLGIAIIIRLNQK